MKFKENIDLQVTQDGLRFAGIYSLKIKDTNSRKRAFSSLIIVNALSDFFMKQGLNVSGTKNLYKVAQISEEFEITDLYVNNWRLDVRLAMPDDSFYIPVSHFENEILPDFYVVATIDKNLQKPEFFGYISPKNLKTQKYNKLYYKSDFEDLLSMSDLLQELKKQKHFICKEKDHKFFHTKILSYFDNEADNFTKTKLLNHILGCQACRTELINFCGFDMIASNLDKHSDLFDDDSLNIIGALNVQSDEEENEDENSSYYQDENGESYGTDSATKAQQDVLLDGLFENTPKVNNQAISSVPVKNIVPDNNDLLPPVNDEQRISLQEPSIKIDDIPSLVEDKPRKKANNPQNDDLFADLSLVFTPDESLPAQNDSSEYKQTSLAESLKDIPDEIFNTEAPKKKSPRKSDSVSSSGGDKIIVDYDEFGQPIYEETKPEDYKIVENEPASSDSFKKENDTENNADITDIFDKGSNSKDNYIDASGENVPEDLVSNVPPQQKKPPKNHMLTIVIVGLIAIVAILCFKIFYNSNGESKEDDGLVPGVREMVDSRDPSMQGNELDTVIAKNTSKKSKHMLKLNSVNWVAQKSLLNDKDFKEYLQLIDKRFRAKFKLNTNSISKAPYNNNVIVEVILTPDGVIKTSRIAQSSGVSNIDKAIEQSIKDATNLVPIPVATQAKLQLDEYYIKIAIKL